MCRTNQECHHWRKSFQEASGINSYLETKANLHIRNMIIRIRTMIDHRYVTSCDSELKFDELDNYDLKVWKNQWYQCQCFISPEEDNSSTSTPRYSTSCTSPRHALVVGGQTCRSLAAESATELQTWINNSALAASSKLKRTSSKCKTSESPPQQVRLGAVEASHLDKTLRFMILHDPNKVISVLNLHTVKLVKIILLASGHPEKNLWPSIMTSSDRDRCLSKPALSFNSYKTCFFQTWGFQMNPIQYNVMSCYTWCQVSKRQLDFSSLHLSILQVLQCLPALPHCPSAASACAAGFCTCCSRPPKMAQLSAKISKLPIGLWDFYGFFVGFLWIFVGFLWIFVGFLWLFCGISMDFCGISMDLCGISMAFFRGFLWIFDDTSEVPQNCCTTSMSCKVYGLLGTLPWLPRLWSLQASIAQPPVKNHIFLSVLAFPNGIPRVLAFCCISNCCRKSSFALPIRLNMAALLAQ